MPNPWENPAVPQAIREWYGNLAGSFYPQYANQQWEIENQAQYFGVPNTNPAAQGYTELGFPRSGSLPPSGPGGAIAARAQMLAEQAVQEYNKGLGEEAQGYAGQATQALLTGMGNFQSYRPGGAASLMANQYGQLAQSYLGRSQVALNRRTGYIPDLMFDARRHAAFEGRQEARKGAYLGFAGGLIGAGLGAAGSIVGGALSGGTTNMNFGQPPTMLGMAEGGVVRPTPGGTQAVIGEGNEPEVVAPLSKVGEVAREVEQSKGGAQAPGPGGPEGVPAGGMAPPGVLPPPPLGMSGDIAHTSPGFGAISAARTMSRMSGMMPDMALDVVEGTITMGSDMGRYLSAVDDQLDQMLVGAA